MPVFALVGRSQRLTQSEDELEHVVRTDAAAEHGLVQSATGGQFHDEVVETVVFTVRIENADDSWVIEFGHDASAAEEARAAGGVTRKIAVEYFDGDEPAAVAIVARPLHTVANPPWPSRFSRR